MRIAFLNHEANLAGGATRSLLDLIDGFRLKRYDIKPYVVSPQYGDLMTELERRRIPSAVVPFPWWMSTRRSLRTILRCFLRNVQASNRLKQLLKQWQIDLVYTNSSVIPVGALVSKMMKVPHIWHLREAAPEHWGWKCDGGNGVFQFLIHEADARIANSRAVRKDLAGKEASENTHVIYNGVASEREFDDFYRRRLNSRKESRRPFTFLIVGSICDRKNQKTAIKALSLVKPFDANARLLIMGYWDPPYLRECEKLVRECGLKDNVEFLGYLADPFPAYFSADAVLVCAKYEPMGRTTAEAMATSCPVIGFDQYGTPELIEHEHTGLLYRNGPRELADCMKRFLRNPGWAAQLGENAWRTARRKFTKEVYAEQVWRVLNTVQTRASHVNEVRFD